MIEVSSSRIHLFEADPDLARFLTSEELAEASQVSVPVISVGREDGLTLWQRMGEQDAFGAIVLEGMVLEQIQVGDRVGMRLFGPGDLVSDRADGGSFLVDDMSVRALPGTRLALLGREVLLANRRWPALTRGLHLRYARQADNLATHLVLCQLPRVDQRLLALMWLLAESWGRVTQTGTTVPLKLTHDVLGALIGARRSTVTLALRALTERGAVVRQDEGWLLLESPTGASSPPEALRAPSLTSTSSRPRSDYQPQMTVNDPAQTMELLRDRLAQLHERHQRDNEEFVARMDTMASVRARCRESRRRVARNRVRRRRSGSRSS